MEEKSVGLGAYAFELRFEAAPGPPGLRTERARGRREANPCLLYTSDAADE